MAMNWARGLDELGTGLLRQADIGNKAYEGAMAKEAETRSANRAFAAEERAATRAYDKEMRADTRAKDLFAAESTRWVEQQAVLQEYSIDNLEKRAELQEESDIKKHGRETAFALKTWRMERYAVIRDLESKAKTERALLDIKNNVSRAESADKKVDKILALWTKAIKDGPTAETDALEAELGKAELQSTEAWARIPGVDPLTTRKLAEFTKFDIIGGEIVNAVSLRTTDTIFREAITAIKQGKGSSGYDAAIETVSRTIDDIIEKDPTFKNYRGPQKRRLKTHVIEKLLPNVQLGEATATDGGNGEVTSDLSGRFESGELWRTANYLSDLEADNDITAADIGTLEEAEAMAPSGPGRTNPKQTAINLAKKRDPVHIIPLLKNGMQELLQFKNQVSPDQWETTYGSRVKQLQTLIQKLEALMGGQTSALPQELDINQSVVGVGGPPPGMLSQGPGMIFEADRMPMDKASVNARYTA